MESLIKAVIENISEIGIGGALLIPLLLVMWQNMKRSDSTNEMHMTMHRQTTDALSEHARANSEIAKATEKQAASVTELSTLIKHVVLPKG